VAANVAGVDISSEVIAHARNRYRDKIIFAVGSRVTIPVCSGSIDVVVSLETLDHIAEYEEMLRKCKRVLRPAAL
jgi:ubiquinone/menaquinone biosynthesis C-methylase UbiE